MSAPSPGSVLTLGGEGLAAAVRGLLARYGLVLRTVDADAPIPGSYHGAPEAGLVGTEVWVSPATPVHSVLHEAAHCICMDGARRAVLDRDAGGDFDEENAVCCLQILLADELPGVGAARMLSDMDAWGYTFRLGSAAAWYAEEAEAPRAWLRRERLVDAAGRPVHRLRP